MRSSLRRRRGGVVLTAALVVAGLAAGSAAAAPVPQPAGAVFVQNDDPAGNAVVAYRRDTDGILHQAATYPTGGRGGVLAGAVVDNLASQGSLAYDRSAARLYAVNAGSDTISVFAVHGERLQLRQVLSSRGEFPVSIAIHGGRLYVLNARDGGSIQGFLTTPAGLVTVDRWHRSLGLDPTQTPEFTHTPGQVAFTPDGRRLLVTTKGNGDAIDVFAFDGHGAPDLINVDREPGTAPFALDFDAGANPLVTQAGPNAVTSYALAGNGALAALQSVPTGQAATCWIVRSGTHVYVSNAGSATLSRLESDGHGHLTTTGLTSTHGGTVDASASPDGRFLYVQTGAAGIVDAFRIGADGSLDPIGSVTVPRAIGGEGIAAA